MRKTIYILLTMVSVFLFSCTAFAASGCKSFTVYKNTNAGTGFSVMDPDSPYHICKQLGIKICHQEKCRVGQRTTQVTAPETTTESKPETTTKKQSEPATSKPVQTTKEVSTEATTSRQEKPQQTTKREPVTETTTYTVNTNSSYAQQVLELVNTERAKNGLSPLTLSSSVTKVAQLKAEDMKNKNYFSHTSPTYGSPFDMLKRFGISYRTAGENIAKGQKTPQAVVNAWMNSPGHRANILGKGYTQLGVGCTGGSSPYWVQTFIG